MKRKCSQCGAVMSQRNPGNRCSPCQKKTFQEMIASGENIIDAEGYALILDLGSAESLKRLARKGLLAPRIPGVKKWLWRRDDVLLWHEQEQRKGDVFRLAVRGLASNLRRCRYDSAICSGLSDKIGGKVYGQEQVMGTTDTGRVEPIALVPVDRSIALNALERLPEEDFPELVGITDWADLTYEIATEGFLVRLEAYF